MIPEIGIAALAMAVVCFVVIAVLAALAHNGRDVSSLCSCQKQADSQALNSADKDELEWDNSLLGSLNITVNPMQDKITKKDALVSADTHSDNELIVDQNLEWDDLNLL